MHVYIWILFVLGGYNYLHSGKASLPTPLESLIAHADYVCDTIYQVYLLMLLLVRDTGIKAG